METQKLAYELREIMYIMGKEKPFKREYNTCIKKHDLMFLHGIHHLNQGKAVKMSEISNYFKISAPAISQIIKRYEKEGYIQREILENDRRSVYINLAEGVIEEITDLENQMNEDLVSLINYLGEDDTKDLIRILKKAAYYEFEKE